MENTEMEKAAKKTAVKKETSEKSAVKKADTKKKTAAKKVKEPKPNFDVRGVEFLELKSVEVDENLEKTAKKVSTLDKLVFGTRSVAAALAVSFLKGPVPALFAGFATVGLVIGAVYCEDLFDRDHVRDRFDELEEADGKIKKTRDNVKAILNQENEILKTNLNGKTLEFVIENKVRHSLNVVSFECKDVVKGKTEYLDVNDPDGIIYYTTQK